jgi:hypothetical protein
VKFRKRCFEFAVSPGKKNAGRNMSLHLKMPVTRSIAQNQNTLPCLTIDGKEFFFTRRVRGFDEDFFCKMGW